MELVAIIICQPSALPHFCLFLSVRNGRSAVLAVRLVCSTLQFYCAGELIRHGSTERERERGRDAAVNAADIVGCIRALAGGRQAYMMKL